MSPTIHNIECYEKLIAEKAPQVISKEWVLHILGQIKHAHERDLEINPEYVMSDPNVTGVTLSLYSHPHW